MDAIEHGPGRASEGTVPRGEGTAGPPSPAGEGPVLLRLDSGTEWLLYFMIVFAPWAFGTTQGWSARVMNTAGFVLGGMAVVRRFAVHGLPAVASAKAGSQPAVQSAQSAVGSSPHRGRGGKGGWAAGWLAGLTAAVLGYCLVSALNARATYVPAEQRFDYHDCVGWLPHSFDSASSWRAFWRYLALAGMFWAARGWVLAGARSEQGAAMAADRRLPARLRRVLWVVSINGALLALEGIVQRSLGTNRLLWLVLPFYNRSPESQFGPYAYRGNAAEYLGMVWPLALGFWWVLRRGHSTPPGPRSAANLLLSCALLTLVAPLISLSRAAALVTCASGVVALAMLLASRRRAGGKSGWGLAGLLVLAAVLSWYIGWHGLAQRFKRTDGDISSGRFLAWRTALQMAKDFPVFGTGPGTFDSLYGLYRSSPEQRWEAYLHNDWLETVVTFGAVGFAAVFLMFILAAGGWFFGGGGIPTPRGLVRFLWLSLAGCLAYAAMDFPLQVYSVLFLFLLICSILSCLSRPGRGAAHKRESVGACGAQA